MNRGITVLSLFDGMSCGQIALEKAGIKVEFSINDIDELSLGFYLCKGEDGIGEFKILSVGLLFISIEFMIYK